MKIYGVALLAVCYIVGKLIGVSLGNLIGISSDVGGVGFAMFFLVFSHAYLHKKGLIKPETDQGILFWSSMYIPIVIAMSSVLNVKAAASGGMLAILAGGLATLVGFLMVPVISRLGQNKQ